MHPVLRTVLQRLGLGLITLFAVSIIIFSSLQMLPGGYAQNILGQGATPETVANFNHELGLDRPAVVRYVEWIGNAVRGDFGNSYSGTTGNIKRSVSATQRASCRVTRASLSRRPMARSSRSRRWPSMNSSANRR